MVLFIMLYKVVLTFKSVDETLVCDHCTSRVCDSHFNYVVHVEVINS